MLKQSAAGNQPKPLRGEEKSPVAALLLGLIPGLGAAYNGQPIKALVHFVITAGLWMLADVFHSSLEVTCALASAAFYFYSLYDAFKSAQRQRAGADLHEEDEQLRQFLRARTNLWGGLLISIGALTTLHVIFPTQTHRFWPLLLVAAGLYLLNEFRGSKQSAEPAPLYRTPPPSVIQPGYDGSTGEFVRAEGRFER